MCPTVEELMDESASKSNLTQQLQKNLRHEEKKNRSLEKKHEWVKCEIDDLTQQNISQFECSEKTRYEIEEKDRKIKQLEEDCANLRNTVSVQTEKCEQLENEFEKLKKDYEKTAKELEEFKKIKMVQENCIECAEIEIERLREKLKHCEKTVSSINENMEISKVINLQDIIDDLKLKLIAANTEIEKFMTNCCCSQVQLKKSRFHVSKSDLAISSAQQSVQLNADNNALSHVSFNDINIIRTEMTPIMEEFTILTIHELSQSMDSIESMPDLLVKKMNKKYGKHWHCFMAEKFIRSSVKYVSETFILFEISKFNFVLLQTSEQPVKEVKVLKESFKENLRPLTKARNAPYFRFLFKNVPDMHSIVMY